MVVVVRVHAEGVVGEARLVAVVVDRDPPAEGVVAVAARGPVWIGDADELVIGVPRIARRRAAARGCLGREIAVVVEDVGEGAVRDKSIGRVVRRRHAAGGPVPRRIVRIRFVRESGGRRVRRRPQPAVRVVRVAVRAVVVRQRAPASGDGIQRVVEAGDSAAAERGVTPDERARRVVGERVADPVRPRERGEPPESVVGEPERGLPVVLDRAQPAERVVAVLQRAGIRTRDGPEPIVGEVVVAQPDRRLRRGWARRPARRRDRARVRAGRLRQQAIAGVVTPVDVAARVVGRDEPPERVEAEVQGITAGSDHACQQAVDVVCVRGDRSDAVGPLREHAEVVVFVERRVPERIARLVEPLRVVVEVLPLASIRVRHAGEHSVGVVVERRRVTGLVGHRTDRAGRVGDERDATPSAVAYRRGVAIRVVRVVDGAAAGVRHRAQPAHRPVREARRRLAGRLRALEGAGHRIGDERDEHGSVGSPDEAGLAEHVVVLEPPGAAVCGHRKEVPVRRGGGLVVFDRRGVPEWVRCAQEVSDRVVRERVPDRRAIEDVVALDDVAPIV